MTQAELTPPSVDVPHAENAPVKKISAKDLEGLGNKLSDLFTAYVSDRKLAELKWTRNLRQYLGIYDPEIEGKLAANRSRAYPRMTRAKLISTVSRIMNLMFPGNERNWQLTASPNADLTKADVLEAIEKAKARDADKGVQSKVTVEYVMAAVKTLSQERAETFSQLIDDQLQEVGGDQTLDFISLNRKVLYGGGLYGAGLLAGPYARKTRIATWNIDPATQEPIINEIDVYKPVFEWVNIWDFYPDMAAKTLGTMDGYFRRHVMTRAMMRDLMDREDFFAEQIASYLQKYPTGNYKPQPFETELRAMGTKANVNEVKIETQKYECISWHGRVSGSLLQLAGCEVDDDKLQDDIDAEVWMVGGNVIKATINPWRELDEDVKMLHYFLFDEDDTSPIGNGLPNIVRDSQMNLCNVARMLMDNASVCTAPQFELNIATLNRKQDLTSIEPWKVWYRDDDGLSAQWPAIREIKIDGHIDELLKIAEFWMKFMDAETFVGPMTGGDMAKMPSEPMRTAAGASMLKGDAALPFKDVIRNFDHFTQSVIYSLVKFNCVFNKSLVHVMDYDVVARGATSLISKEVRGMQIDTMLANMPDEIKLYADMKQLAKLSFEARDLNNAMVSDEEAARRQAQQDQQGAEQAEQMKKMMEAQLREVLAGAFKDVAQGQKNSAMADAQSVKSALELLEKGLSDVGIGPGPDGQSMGGGAPEPGAPGSAGAQAANAASGGAPAMAPQ